MEVSKTFTSVVRLLSVVLDAYTTAFFITDPKTGRLDLAAVQSLSKFIGENVSLPIDESGILSQVQKIGQTIHMDKIEVEEVSGLVPLYGPGESLLKGICAVPVGDGAGVLYVDTKYSWGFSDKQRKCIREAANVLNDLLDQQECVSRQEGSERMLDLWRRVDEAGRSEGSIEECAQEMVNECARFLGVENAFMALKEPGENVFRLIAFTSSVPRGIQNQSFPVDRGLLGWVFKNERTLSIPKLNPDSPDHFLFYQGESLPHQGVFLGIPVQLSPERFLVLAFLDRRSLQWNQEDQHAVARVLHAMQLVFDRLHWRELCEDLQVYDLSTKLYNALAFEQWVEASLASSMRSSKSFTLAVVQIDPWHVFYSKAPPREVHRLQKTIAGELYEMLPEEVVVGQVSENRFGLLFPEAARKDVEVLLQCVTDPGEYKSLRRLGNMKLRIHAGWAAFPHDATTCEELWPLVYQRLFASAHSFSEKRR